MDGAPHDTRPPPCLATTGLCPLAHGTLPGAHTPKQTEKFGSLTEVCGEGHLRRGGNPHLTCASCDSSSPSAAFHSWACPGS